MTTPTLLYKGANLVLERPLFESDGVTSIAPSDLTLCECELWLGDRRVKKFVLGTDDELRANQADTGLLLELTSALSATLAKGRLVERYRLGVASASHTAEEPNQSIHVIRVEDVLVME